MLGEGLIHVRPVASNSSRCGASLRRGSLPGRGPDQLAAEHPASSPTVMPCRTGRRCDNRRTTRGPASSIGPVTSSAADRDWAGRARRNGRSLLGGRLHGVAHGRDVRVESGADVLDVEHQRVEPVEHLGRGPPGLAVEAVDTAGPWLRARLSAMLATSSLPCSPCSGLKRATSSTLGASCRESIVADAVAADARLVGDQPDCAAGKLPEAVALQDIDPGQHGSGDRRRPGAPDRDAAAAIVPIRPASGLTEPLPSGCSRLLRGRSRTDPARGRSTWPCR